ncbi:mycothiol synthase [Luteipulveratus sp. YIM 133132]|uniref:mycothiol synthase n=1 Tax=Luteipulveratus flavus TaxID=3031728 RepID=UPI0023B0A6FD|nr:mycothiol synthase [Luteipulveratus sp. YIM 133132]MDE9365520.1 mycothiol synthase [Luteipulveratus sp. YIM 133132]
MQQSTALSPAQVDAVHAVAQAAAAADGVAPLSEETLLALDRTPGGDGTTATYLTVVTDGTLVGYGHVAPDGSSEIVVHPDSRRHGHGRALLEGALGVRPDVRVWAHGNLAPARALAASLALEPVRELWRMSLDVESHPAPEPVVPRGFRARSFEPGRDEQAWLDVNSRAFAHHPEQGRMTLADLRDRMDQPWFDPAGLILVEDQKSGALAASHWTKIADEGGEVYVVAVDPAYQGRGLGGVVTALGLRHLASRGVARIDLYVEGDNAPALATYRRLGFEQSALDVMYSRTVHERLPR